jgi:hypothetical protein
VVRREQTSNPRLPIRLQPQYQVRLTRLAVDVNAVNPIHNFRMPERMLPNRTLIATDM